jgi:predicted nucleotidyltransferase
MDGFTLVERKKRHGSCRQIKTLLDKNNVITDVKLIMEKYKPFAVYIYGSVARGEHHINSDVDLMVLWKAAYMPCVDKLHDIKKELTEALNVKVDFVIMEYTRIYQEPDINDELFIKNVLTDAVVIIGKNIDHINNSIKLRKI